MDGTRQGTYDASAKGDTRGVDLSYNGRLGEESKARLRAVCAFFFFFFGVCSKGTMNQQIGTRLEPRVYKVGKTLPPSAGREGSSWNSDTVTSSTLAANKCTADRTKGRVHA